MSDALPDAPPASRDRFRVALTGCHTFLGRRLLDALEHDPRCEHVLALDVRPPSRLGTKTRFVRLDLTNPSADEQAGRVLASDGIDVLCHLAFLAFPSHASSWAHELEAIGTFYVMNAAAEASVGKVVLASTTMVYGAWPDNPNYITEGARLRGTPGSRWVRDRVSAERELGRLGKDCPDICTTSLRFCTTLGPSIRSFHARMLAKPRLPAFMGYDPLMQFLHEDDAVAALLHAVRRDCPGAYNVVGDGVVPWSQVRLLGGKVPVSAPHGLARPVASMLWNLQLVDVPPRFMNFYRFSWVADGRRMRDVMGFVPRHTSKDTLERYFAWIAERRAGRRPASAAGGR